MQNLPVKLGNKFVSILSVALLRTQSDACWFEPMLQSLDPFDEESDLRQQTFVPAGKAEIEYRLIVMIVHLNECHIPESCYSLDFVIQNSDSGMKWSGERIPYCNMYLTQT